MIRVSDIDKDLLITHWNVYRNKQCHYAQRSIRNAACLRGYSKEKLHRVVMARVIGRPLHGVEVVDHINFDGLDNRRENLRIVTKAENNARVRRKKRPGATTTYRGVSRNRSAYVAFISINGALSYLGSFRSEEMAARAYDYAAWFYHGEMAILNFERKQG